ncbi:MAG: hypothetical protein ACXWC2_00455 [Ramlibacter sp.]
MFLSRTMVFAVSLLVAAIAWVVAPAAVGRSLKAWEVIAIGAAILGLLQWRRQRRLRLQRQALESIRDSALW